MSLPHTNTDWERKGKLNIELDVTDDLILILLFLSLFSTSSLSSPVFSLMSLLSRILSRYFRVSATNFSTPFRLLFLISSLFIARQAHYHYTSVLRKRRRVSLLTFTL